MSQVIGMATPSLWSALCKLMRLRMLILLSSFRRASLRGKIGMAVLGLLSVSLMAVAFVLSYGLLRLLRSPRLAAILPEAERLLTSMPVLIVGVGFLAILLTSFGVLLQALYLAGDMDFLLSAPVPVRAVFVSKLLQAILPNLTLLCLFALPVLFGLGASAGYNLLFYPLAVVMLVALSLAAAGLASLVVMGVVRIFPARRVAEVLGFVGALTTMLCSQSGNLMRGTRVSPDQATTLLRLLVRFDEPWSPLAWAGRGLVSIGDGRWLAGVGFSLLALGSAGLVFALALTTAEHLYYSGWAGMQARQRHRKMIRPPHRAAAQPLAGFGGRFLPAAVGAIIAKDWTMLRRDLRNLSQLVTPLILGVVYAVMLLRGRGDVPAGRGGAPTWFLQSLEGLIAYGNIAIALFVGWTLLARLAAMGFSQEGKHYWLLKAAPVSAGRLLLAKFLAAYLPALVLSGGFAGILALLQPAGSVLSALWFSLVVVALCLAGVTGIYLAFGVSGAKMDWQDPRQMVSGATGCLGALVSALGLVVALGLFAGPQFGLALLGWPDLVAQLVGLALGGSFCLACALVPLRMVRGKVPRLGEQ